MASFLKSIVSAAGVPPMCENCGIQPQFGNFNYCGKSCAAEAEKKRLLSENNRLSKPSTAPGYNRKVPNTNLASESTMCEVCGVWPKFSGYEYCGRTCALKAKNQKSSSANITNASGPANPAAGPGFVPSSSSAGLDSAVASSICENCYVRPKSEEVNQDGTAITHPYCGISCYKASQCSIFPASTIPAPAAAASVSSDLTKLRTERINTPIGRRIRLMMQERWQSDELDTPQLEGVYRIDLSGQVYQRFDLALQMHDSCTITTTYYGGAATCNIADHKDPAPCGSGSCDVCDVLRSSFGNLLYGASARDGAYGHGLYTYTNPALAHHVAVSDDNREAKNGNHTLIQCRVVTRATSRPSSDPYAGFIDDLGVVFCAQPLAIIPTHLLIYRTTSPSNSHQAPTNTNPVSLSQAAPVGTIRSNDSRQANWPPAGGGGPQRKPAQYKGKGKARATDTLQNVQKGIPGATSAADAEASAVPPSSGGEDRTIPGTTVPQAFNQSNLTSPASGYFYVQTPAGYVPIQHPPPGIPLYTLEADGNFYPAQPTAPAPVTYPPFPINALSPVATAGQGPQPTPTSDQARAALRASIISNLRKSLPTPRSPPQGQSIGAAEVQKHANRPRDFYDSYSRMDEEEDQDDWLRDE